MKIIGIETSHDDTSFVVYENKKIIWELAFSQTKFHEQFGGTVPELASRIHLDSIGIIVEKMTKEADLSNLEYIAYTSHPGLKGSLQMGFLAASALSLALKKPLVPVNHLHGHIFAVEFTENITFPALALIISGGHSQLWLVNSYTDLKIIGETQDDAIGEVYDKVGRMLNLGFPGGPIIDQICQKSQKKQDFDFKIKILNEYDMSFSGLKTKILNLIHNYEQKNQEVPVDDICINFQNSVTDFFEKIMKKAIKQFSPQSIILGGGVSANSQIREMFLKLSNKSLIPEKKYSLDNGAMIAITCDLIKNKK